MKGIYDAHWFGYDIGEYRLVIDKSPQMGESVRIGFVTRYHGLEPTTIGFMVPRGKWEELESNLCEGRE